MSGFVDLFNRKKMVLIVSLPQNDPEMAQAALKNGADAIKVHINLHHRASGNTFNSLREEEEKIVSILEFAREKVVGFVPGDSIERVKEEEIHRAEALGLGFYSVYLHHAPSFLLNTGMARMLAVGEDMPLELISTYKTLPFDILEASIMGGERYGTPLNLKDLMHYRYLVQHSGKPVVVPTQAKIEPGDINWLHNAGVRGVMIGAVATGTTAQGVGDVCSSFRKAIDELKN
jgi:hypothetical protein